QPVTPSGNSDDTANPTGDGISNLLKYAIGLSPALASNTSPATQGTATATINSVTGAVLTLAFNRIADPALTYSVEAVDDVSGTWASIWTSTGAANVAGSVTVQDTALMSSKSRRFLRLCVSH